MNYQGYRGAQGFWGFKALAPSLRAPSASLPLISPKSASRLPTSSSVSATCPLLRLLVDIYLHLFPRTCFFFFLCDSISWSGKHHFIIIFKDLIYLFLERGEGKEKEQERNINVWLPRARPPLGTWPATQACALTGNQTSDPLVLRPALNPLSHTSQGS